MLQPALTIIVPVHNKTEVLPQTAEALLNQSLPYENCEVIYIDDHSTDGSGKFLDGLARVHPAQVLRRAGSGGSAARARNAGLEAARGRHCLFLDADVLVGSNFLDELLRCVSSSRDVLLIPTMGSSGSTQTWPFLSAIMTASGEADSILRECRENSLLSDARLQWCDPQSGDFEALPAAWVFCWTTAVVVDTGVAREVGGFPTNLNGKGSEDIAFGLRLHEAGARFRMARMESVLHLPHWRDSTAEDERDREHERRMLRHNPRFEVEMLAAFGADNANPALNAFCSMRREPWIEDWPRCAMPVERQPGGRLILLGAACENLRETFQPTESADPSFTRTGDSSHLPLLGLALPYDDGELDWAVIPDCRGLLPESLICRIFQEATRVAKRVLVALLPEGALRRPIVTEATSRQFDRPYWERTFRLSRSYYDWDLLPFQSFDHFELYELLPHGNRAAKNLW